MTIAGQVFEVKVKFVNSNDADKRWMVECETPTEPLPRKVGALQDFTISAIHMFISSVLVSVYSV